MKVLPCFVVFREDHGHHEHESYYGDRDTDSIVKVDKSKFRSSNQE